MFIYILHPDRKIKTLKEETKCRIASDVYQWSKRTVEQSMPIKSLKKKTDSRIFIPKLQLNVKVTFLNIEELRIRFFKFLLTLAFL